MEPRSLGCNVEKALVVEPACRRVGQSTQTTATFLAALCGFFGIALAARLLRHLKSELRAFSALQLYLRSDFT
jgi:hypothetical protein